MERAIAVDWSGALDRAGSKIWLAEVSRGELVRLQRQPSREAAVEEVLRLASDGACAIGLDFAFSMPAWFVRQHAASAAEFWARVAEHGDAWLAACAPPFWGRPGRKRPAADDGCPPFRRTEEAYAPGRDGIRPKSVFQVGGAGAVGTGSLRGMPYLLRLQAAGIAVWPFFEGTRPVVAVEIYPRLLTGPVRKSDRLAREAYLDGRGLTGAGWDEARSSEDAFDAAVSALAMWERRDDLAKLRATSDPVLLLEGAIWDPGCDG
ncbi:MAG TPA: hypothetical protein VFC53_12555 [Dehalococcoidia bacterium]|nr:hypothetical protein [Dehalococcoidia bacterium]